MSIAKGITDNGDGTVTFSCAVEMREFPQSDYTGPIWTDGLCVWELPEPPSPREVWEARALLRRGLPPDDPRMTPWPNTWAEFKARFGVGIESVLG